MPEFTALIESVNQSVSKLELELESTQETLDRAISKIDNFPKDYIPRSEADIKAERVKKALAGGVVGLLTLSGAGVWLNSKFVDSCKRSREGLQEVINVAVADRQPLPTSSPDTIAAIEEVNRNQVRPLREKLLSLDGTQPSKC